MEIQFSTQHTALQLYSWISILNQQSNMGKTGVPYLGQNVHHNPSLYFETIIHSRRKLEPYDPHNIQCTCHISHISHLSCAWTHTNNPNLIHGRWWWYTSFSHQTLELPKARKLSWNTSISLLWQYDMQKLPYTAALCHIQIAWSTRYHCTLLSCWILLLCYW